MGRRKNLIQDVLKMKLYLSSFRLGDNPQTLVELMGPNRKIGVIANSMDFLGDSNQRNEKYLFEADALKNIGLDPFEIDLRNYFEKPNELKKVFSDTKALWVRGGNVFVLRRAFFDSGFDNIFKNILDEPNFVYGGYSAGCCILGPSLKGFEIVDNVEDVKKTYSKNPIWEGLGIFPYYFIPHYRSDHPESEMIEKEVEYLKKIGASYRTLRDGEVIIYD